jgi:hypothetical protein
MKTVQKISRVVIVYVLWLLAVVASFLVLLRLYNTLNLAWPVFGGDPFVLRGVARVYIMIAGVAWMIYIFVIEWHFQRSFSDERRSSAAETQPEFQAPSQPDVQPESEEGDRWIERSGFRRLLRRFAIALSVPLVLFLVDVILRLVAFGALRG